MAAPIEHNGVATLTFNLPGMANAMDLLGVQETLDALRRCETRPDIGAVKKALDQRIHDLRGA